MSEQRLIDANRIVEVANHAYDKWNLAMATQDTNRGVNKVFRRQELCKVVKAVAEDAPTIDPETLPIVRELREKLERVTAERDAAIKDRAELADFELTVCEQFCFGDRKHDIPPCEWNRFGRCQLREWRGLVAENATAESEPKSQWKELAELQPLEGVWTKEEAEKNRVPGAAPERSNRNG